MNPLLNKLLTALNSVGEAFCEHAAGVFVQTAILVVVLYAVDLFLRRRVRAVFRYCVWLLVLVKLILPPTLSLPTGIGYWASDHVPSSLNVSGRFFDLPGLEFEGELPEGSHVGPSEGAAETGPPVAATNAPLPDLTWKAILFILWVMGVFAFLALLIQRGMFVRGLIAASRPSNEEFTEVLEQCRRQIGVRLKTTLRISETISSPAVCGFFRPIILIPAGLVGKLSTEGLRAILIHELAHIKRADLWVNSIQTFLQVVYFYNPFVWFANSMIRKVCEEAVDETVLVTLGGKARDYSNTLIDIGEMVFRKADLGLRLIGVAESKKALQWRIKHMLNRPIPKNARLGVAGMAVLLVTAAVLLPMAKAERRSREKTSVAAIDGSNSTKSLHVAARDGDLEQVKRLIAEGADVNATNDKNKTPLCAAVFRPGHLEVVRFLLANGAKIDVADSYGYTPLFYAIWSDDEVVVRTLISSGADVNRRAGANEKDLRPLVYAVWQDQPAIVRALIDAGADVEQEDYRGWSPLQNALAIGNPHVVGLFANTDEKVQDVHRAALRGDLWRLKELISKGADLNEKDEFDQTPLYYALAASQGEAAKFLIDQGAATNITARYGRTLLHQASRAGLLETVQMLVARDVPLINTSSNCATPLHDAVRGGHKEVAEFLISKSIPVDSKKGLNGTPLQLAASLGKIEMVEFLIEQGADLSVKNSKGKTPSDLAEARGHTEIVELLRKQGTEYQSPTDSKKPKSVKSIHQAAVDGDIEQVRLFVSTGTDVNSGDASERTPLHYAAYAGRKDVVQVLIEAGADVNCKDKYGQTPTVLAMKGWHNSVVDLLISKGADVTLDTAIYLGDLAKVKSFIESDPDVNETQLNWLLIKSLNSRGGVKQGYKEVAQYLLQKGASPNARDRNNATILHAWAWGGDFTATKAVIEFMIGKGADIKARQGGWTPLHTALDRHRGRVAKVLIDHGADVTAKDGRGRTVLHYAASGGMKDVVELLVAKGVDIPDFHRAAWAGDLARVKELVEQGTDIDTKDEGGWTALHWAASIGHRGLAEYLIANGADVNAKAKDSSTPLHRAAQTGNIDTAALLVDKGANINVGEGYETPLEIAAGHSKEMVEWLIAKGANVNADAGGWPALVSALGCERFEIVELLLAKGADVNIKYSKSRTPLHYTAMHYNNPKIVELLISKGADINAKDNNGITAMDFAKKSGHTEVVEMLKKHGAKE